MARKNKTPEKTNVEKPILKYLKTIGVFAFSVNCGFIPIGKVRFFRATSINGVPDIIAIHDGKFIGIECKYGTGTQQDSQKEFERLSKDAGAIYLLAYSPDDVKKYFNENYGLNDKQTTFL